MIYIICVMNFFQVFEDIWDTLFESYLASENN